MSRWQPFRPISLPWNVVWASVSVIPGSGATGLVPGVLSLTVARKAVQESPIGERIALRAMVEGSGHISLRCNCHICTSSDRGSITPV